MRSTAILAFSAVYLLLCSFGNTNPHDAAVCEDESCTQPFIQKAFVISLQHQEKRRANFQKQMHRFVHPFPFEFIKAFDQNDARKAIESGDVVILKEFRDPNQERQLKLGEVGCAMSHYYAWNRIVEENLDRAAIFEDDATFEPIFLDYLKKIQRELAEYGLEWDLFYLTRKEMDWVQVKKVSPHIEQPGYSYWGLAYVLTKDGAKKLLEGNLLKQLIPVDEYLPVAYGAHINQELVALFAGIPRIKALASVYDLANPAIEGGSSTEASELVPLVPSFILAPNHRMVIAVTWTAHAAGSPLEEVAERLEESTKFFGLPVLRIPVSEEYVKSEGGQYFLRPQWRVFIGFIQRVVEALDRMQPAVSQSDNAMVLVVDPYRAVMVRSVEHLVKTFDRIRDTRPIGLLFDSPGIGKSSLDTTTAPMFVGYVSALRQLIAVAAPEEDSIHAFIRERAVSDALPFEIAVDSGHQVFLPVDRLHIEDWQFDLPGLLYVPLATHPTVLYASSPLGAVLLANLANYIPNGWREFYGHTVAQARALRGQTDNRLAAARVFIAVWYHGTPFVDVFAQGLYNLSITREKTILWIASNANKVSRVPASLWPSDEEERVVLHRGLAKADLVVGVDETEARWLAVEEAIANNCTHMLWLDSQAVLSEATTVQRLLAQDRMLVAPALCIDGTLYCNYWGNVTANGWYVRSWDILDLYNGERRGLWTVPYVSKVYLVKRDLLLLPDFPNMHANQWPGVSDDTEVGFCSAMRLKGLLLHVENLVNYGSLLAVNSEEADDVWNMQQTNQQFWVRQYVLPHIRAELERPGEGALAPASMPICGGMAEALHVFLPRFSLDIVENLDSALPPAEALEDWVTGVLQPLYLALFGDPLPGKESLPITNPVFSVVRPEKAGVTKLQAPGSTINFVVVIPLVSDGGSEETDEVRLQFAELEPCILSRSLVRDRVIFAPNTVREIEVVTKSKAHWPVLVVWA